MSTRDTWLGLALLGTLACGADPAPAAKAQLAGYDLAAAPAWRATLPAELTEISGLAVTADGRLFAHGDERGTVFEVEPRTGKVRKSFALERTGSEPDLGKKAGDAEVTGDFEGITIVGDRFFLVTSNGVLVEFAEGADGERVSYAAYPTGLDQTCEVEGLTHDPAGETLLVLCKQMRRKQERDRVTIHAWSLQERRLDPSPRIVTRSSDLARLTGAKAFNASALEFTPGGRSLVMTAGPQQAFAEIGIDGRPVHGGALDRAIHPQPEGIAFLPDGTLLVSSEGGKGEATLSGYLPR
jgi:uncharacterized protein YjiK